MINRTILQGRLTRDPELRETNSGISVCSFTVAWSEKFKEQETKLFLPCTAWRGTAEMVSRNFSKGREIAVEGRLSTKEWDDKNGNHRTSIEMAVDRVHFCGPKAGEQPSIPAAPSAPEPADFVDVTDADGNLPF